MEENNDNTRKIIKISGDVKFNKKMLEFYLKMLKMGILNLIN